MTTKATEGLEARSEQSKASKRATFELLSKKKRATRDVVVDLGDGELTLVFQAIGAIAYDKLLSKNPPTTEQKADGSIYNINTFGPSLLALVCTDPELTKDQWSEIWHSDDWNRGEVMGMFFIAIELCNKGLDIPFTENG
jgi:hypothetical protein